MLLAPVLALMQSWFVIGALLGFSTGWNSQPRDDRSTTLAEALSRHTGTTLLGIVWAVLVRSIVPELFWWLAPVLAGMILAVPLSVLSSRVSAGQWARRRGLFLTPEEVAPPRVLRQLHAHLAEHEAAPAVRDERSALARVLEDESARAAHLAFAEPLPPDGERDELHEHRLQGLVLKCRLHGPDSLSVAEQRELLLAPHALLELAGGP
jgi:membrane glycosyltransferase